MAGTLRPVPRSSPPSHLSRRIFVLGTLPLSPYWQAHNPRPALRDRLYSMEVDPGATEPQAASSSSLKRPQDDAPTGAETALKRLRPYQDGCPDTDTTTEAAVMESSQPEAEARADEQLSGAVGEKGKDEKGRVADKRRQKGGKKGKDKEYVRTRRRGTRPEGEEAPQLENGEPKAPRLPKRPVALLIGFCGDGYNGMQMCVCRLVSRGFHVHNGLSASQTRKCAPSKECFSMRSSKLVQCPKTTRITQQK